MHLVAVPEGVAAVLGQVSRRVALDGADVTERRGQILGQAVGHIDPEAVDAAVGPEAQGVPEVRADLGVVPVEVGLLGGEEVEVPPAVGQPGPGGAAEAGDPVGGRQLAQLALALAEDIALPRGGSGLGGQRLLEPEVLVGGVVGHDVHHHLEAQAVRLGHHGVEVVEGAEPRVDIAVVVDVIAAVGQLRGVEGAQPDGVHAQVGEVGQPGGHTGEVTDAVAVGVGEAARIHLVDDGLPPPVGGVAVGAEVLCGHVEAFRCESGRVGAPPSGGWGRNTARCGAGCGRVRRGERASGGAGLIPSPPLRSCPRRSSGGRS